MRNSLLFAKRCCLIRSIYRQGERFQDGLLLVASERQQVQSEGRLILPPLRFILASRRFRDW